MRDFEDAILLLVSLENKTVQRREGGDFGTSCCLDFPIRVEISTEKSKPAL
jgi:hypothetical protein